MRSRVEESSSSETVRTDRPMPHWTVESGEPIESEDNLAELSLASEDRVDSEDDTKYTFPVSVSVTLLRDEQ